MSTLVVVKKNGYATIACDSLSVDGSIKVCPTNKTNNHKFFKHKDSYIGVVGWANFNNILEDIFVNDSYNLKFDDEVSIFKSLLKTHQIMKDEYFLEMNENNNQPVESSQLDGLVVSPNGIFEFDSYRGVDEYNKYWAQGSGRRYALGALHSSFDKEDATSEELAIKAVEAGCCFDDASDLPVLFKTIQSD